MSEKDEQSNEENETDKDQANKSLSERTSVLEWIVAAIGLILVTFSVGYISYQSIIKESKPPELNVKVSSVNKQLNGYLVEFKVKNEGDETASNVVIEGQIRNGDEEVEKKTTTIDYIASGSEKKAGFFYTENPQKYKLEIKALGYEKP